jgi:rRNA maturation endonuclease Nob1
MYLALSASSYGPLVILGIVAMIVVLKALLGGKRGEEAEAPHGFCWSCKSSLETYRQDICPKCGIEQ